MLERTWGKTLSDFSKSILLENIKKIEGDPLETLKIFEKNVSQCRKNEIGTL